jgi:hypothetical protein
MMNFDWVKPGTKIRCCCQGWTIENPLTGEPFEVPEGLETHILHIGPGEARDPGGLGWFFVGEEANDGDIIVGWIDFGNGGPGGYITQMRGDFVSCWEPVGEVAKARARPKRNMILKRHPDQPGVETTSRFIGFWASSPDPDADAQRAILLPWPEDFVDETWDAEERERVVKYLKKAPFVEHWKGLSNCRLGCSKDNGYRDHGDGTFVWPEGFVHYVENHGVRPPEEFVEHVRRCT